MRTYGAFGRYSDWVCTHDTVDDNDRIAIRQSIRRMGRSPLFSIILLPIANGGHSIPHTAIASIRDQIYPHLELWLPAVPAEIDIKADCRLHVISTSAGADLASMFNTALAEVEGDFVLPLPWDASLAETALYELALAIAECPDVDLLYTDEDQMGATGERCAPYFKTGWDPDLALGRDAIGLLAAYRRAVLQQLGGMQLQANSVALTLYDLSLRVAFAVPARHIWHIPAVLCHRDSGAGSLLGWNAEAARQIVRAHLGALEERAIVVPAPLAPCWSRVVWDLPDRAPLVSIIVPTRDHAELLEKCAKSILSHTAYPAIELLIVDNDSREPTAVELLHRLSQDARVRVLSYLLPFNYAAQINLAARQARGEVLVLLNNDTEALMPEWLREMVSHALRPDVGAVGAKLIYPDLRIQHAGMVLGPGLWPQHQLRFADRMDAGPNGELALTRTVSVVTGACLALRRSVFAEVGGLDERLKVAFNDVDICLRIGDCGYRVVWTPFAELLHLESASRGRDDTSEKLAIAEREAQLFWRSWRSLRHDDPFHNPNLVYGWDALSLSWPPRRKRPWLT